MWLLSPNSSNPFCIFNITESGFINDYTPSANYHFAVRPVVYLKPSINIISGEGTEQNPYILG